MRSTTIFFSYCWKKWCVKSYLRLCDGLLRQHGKNILRADTMRRFASTSTILVLLAFLRSDVFAGGPLNTFLGRAVVYQSSDLPLPYRTDQGPLGSFSSGEATSLVTASFNTWQNVSTATITFYNEGQLPDDVTSTNYGPYLDNFNDGINPVIFDSDGSIIDAEFGAGASDSIIGFAGSAYDTTTGYYLEGLAVLNGKFSAVFTFDQFKATFVHELGHLIGLDHSQINVQYVHDGITSNDIYVPTMYPTATDDDTSLGSLNPDDQAALTLLYPAANSRYSYGKIEGTVVRGDNQPVLGANVVAVKIGDEEMSQFSSVSDYYMQRNGEYSMLVTPGSYKLFIEPINKAFTGGSRVGPYAETTRSASFVNPVTKEYYNGDEESADETDLNDFVIISVAAGETVSGIDFIASGGRVPIIIRTTTIPYATTIGPISTTVISSTTSVASSTSSSTNTTTTAPAGCPAASALLEDYEAIEQLRCFRDVVLGRSAEGREIIKLYYQGGPIVSKAMEENEELKLMVRQMLYAVLPLIDEINKSNGCDFTASLNKN